ncbi:alpha/beta fold hydrolase [Nocardia takedensis]|uniref:alpha/beta fold hydrolase n=1 Tax=Nocardia takedensis TaxID=259390 RepID=UPI00030FCA71|nr:alpha/beta hydrolase [Nocardia takedensis]
MIEMSRVWRGAGAVLLLAGVALSGAGVAGAAEPTLDWTACPSVAAFPGMESLQCAALEVPMDHAVSDGPTVQVALFKSPARDPDRRKGSLIINRGGPGYPTSLYLMGLVTGSLPSPWDERVWQQYDVIAVDRRGVGFATPAVTCFDTVEAMTAFGADVPVVPLTAEDLAVRAVRDAEFATRCRQRAGDLLDHLTTAAVAKDLDRVRAALGEDRLHFLGQSYGAALGLVYANLYPDRVGSFVLDSVLDPTASAPSGIRSEATNGDLATTEAMNEALRLCAAGRTCAFAADDPVRAFPELLVRLRERPIPLTASDGTSTTLTYSKLVAYLGGALYQPAMWPQIRPDLLLHLAYRAAGEPDSAPTEELARLVIDTTGALEVARLLAGSRVLVHEGIGHIATQQSRCAVTAVSDYLASGILPAEGATCPPDTIPSLDRGTSSCRVSQDGEVSPGIGVGVPGSCSVPEWTRG